MQENKWSLAFDEFKPDLEKLREALCTVGNAYFCTRGAAPEARADQVHYPGTYFAGGYNRLKTDISGRTIENEDLVNMPNWLPLSFRIEGGEWFDMRKVKILDYRQELDLKRGLLLRTVRFEDDKARISELRQRRLAHLRNHHLAALETVFRAENWTGEVEFCSALDGRVKNDNVERYSDLASRHLESIETQEFDGECIYLKVRTNQSLLQVAQAARTRVFVEGTPKQVERRLVQEDGYIGQQFSVSLQENEETKIEKIVSLFNSRDVAISEAGLEARKEVGRAAAFQELVHEHIQAWDHLWHRFGMKIDENDSDEPVQMILNLHIFHLLQTVSVHSIKLDVGVPSRGWHGEAYRGHIFWDELFIFPLLNLRTPEITRTLLLYRYRRLREARSMARDAGYRGAMYPWQSGSNGREESQKVHLNPKSGNWIPDNSRLQRHVNAAIAWNAWLYYQVTCDMQFLSFYGAEMILEIARFWASIATWNEEHQRYEILGVMGPDEYHDAYPDAEEQGLNNNAYTNVMAVWVLICALRVLETLPDDRCRELCESLDLHNDEIEKWEEISRRMRLVFHDDGIISQFEGYDDLEEFDWKTYRRKYGRVMRLDRILEAEDDTPNRYKCSKQADVLMLFYLLSAEELREIFDRLDYPFEYETIPKNIDYYLKRTSHGSTLSQVVHSWVLSRSDRERSWKLFTLALHSDIDDIQGGTTPEGIHLGAMAGTVDLVQRGYAGIEARGDVLHLNPCLPRELDHLEMNIRYRGQSLQVEISRQKMKLTCIECHAQPVRVAYGDDERTMCGGDIVEFDLPTDDEQEKESSH